MMQYWTKTITKNEDDKKKFKNTVNGYIYVKNIIKFKTIYAM